MEEVNKELNDGPKKKNDPSRDELERLLEKEEQGLYLSRVILLKEQEKNGDGTKQAQRS